MFGYLVSAFNLWAAYTAWYSDFQYGKPLAVICALLSLYIFLLQRDMDEANKIEKDDE